MDGWDDYEDYDDDKWDFGDTGTKSEPSFHVQLPGTKNSNSASRQAPWMQTEQPVTAPTAPSKPPENAARQKRFQRAQDARRQCTAGSFSLGTVPAGNQSIPTTSQGNTRPVPTGYPERSSQPQGYDPLVGLGRGAVEPRPAWFPGGRGRGIIDQPVGNASNETLSTMHVTSTGSLPGGIGRGRGRGYGAMAQVSNIPSKTLVGNNTSRMPESTHGSNVDVMRNVDQQFQSMSMHSIASDLLNDVPSEKPLTMSSQNKSEIVDRDNRVMPNIRTDTNDTSVSQVTTAANIETSKPTQTFSEKKVDFEELQYHNPDVSVSWMAKMMGVDESGNHIPSEDSIPLGSAEVDNDWLLGLERKWKANDRSTIGVISGLLRDCFRSVVNPYVTVLNILENVKDFHSAKTTTLAFSIVKEFERWSKDDKDQHKVCVNRDVRVRALDIACRANMTYFDLMAKAYRLAHDGNDYFLPYIHSYLSKQKYKEASHCVARLGLQDHFDIKDICLPLILQDKVNMVEQYVSRRHNQQVALVQLLDHLVDTNTDLLAIIQEVNVPKMKHDKMTKKIIAKLAIRLMKLYKIPQEKCPNISNERTMKGLRYLMYKKYIEKGLGYEQWVELVKGTVDESAALQLQLVDQLIDYLDMAEAAKWAKHYGLPNDKLPHQISHLVQTAGSLLVDEEDDWNEESVDTTTSSAKYHALSLGPEALHIVDTRQKFLTAMEHISLPGAMVGIDAEWKPTFGQTVVSRLALIQLATVSDVFLLDVITLHRVLAEGDWKRLATDFFANPDILKLGYAIQGDLQMLVKSVPSLAEPMSGMQRVVDLPTLYSAICRACPDMFDGSADDIVAPPVGDTDDTKVIKQEERGLSDLVKQCLGRPLNKQQQMSDWERRPLRQQQVVYAALDAFCLIEVYNKLTAKAYERKLGIDLEPCLGYKSKPRKTKAERKQQRVAERPDKGSRVRPPPNPPARTGAPTSPKDFRVVCDTMLQGLGRYLRVCGADVVILENDATHDKAAVIARNEDRIVLTSGGPFMMLRGQVPIGYCFNVGPGKARDQVVEVLEHYNVAVTPEDIFSRCQTCNSCDYLYIAPEEMRQAWMTKMTKLCHDDKINCKAQKTNDENPKAKELEYNAKDDTDKGDLSYEYDHLDMETLKVGPNKVPLQVEAVPEGMLEKVDMFFVCAMCGKVTKVRDQFAHVMKEDRTGQYLGNFIKGKAKLK